MEEEGFSLRKALFGSIRKKLAIWIGITVILLLIIAISNSIYINNIEETYEKIETDIVPGTIALVEMKENVEKLKAYTLGYILRGDVEKNGKTVKEWINETELTLSNTAIAHVEYDMSRDVEEQHKAEELEKKTDQLAIVSNKIVEMKDNGAEVKELLDAMNKAYKPLYFPLVEQLDQHLIVHKIELADAGNFLDRQIAETNTISISLTLFALVLSIVVGFFISRSIIQPVKKLSNANFEIEKGNFKVRVDIKTGDELEELGNAFNKSTEALERMDKEHKQLEHAKTEFLSITSHELRSPMTPMKAQLQMLEEGYFGKLNEKQKQSLDIVLRNTNRLDNIVVDFLEISRIEAARLKFRFKKADLAVNVKRLVEEMKGWMPEKKIEIVAKIGEVPTIEVDPDRVMQVLRNLINNAKKFSPVNSKIIVAVGLKGKWIQFSVKDQGIGIAKERQASVFEPFFQEEQTMYRKHGGTGLGLTICKGIVESQGGRIWIESEKGKGATFSFTIPLKPEREIKAIKLLFSPKEDMQKKIALLFTEMLGPLGKKEFEECKSKQLCTEDKLLEYAVNLQKKGIITNEIANEFKHEIDKIFKESKEIKAEKTTQIKRNVKK